ncbi:hypothetical protein ACS0TY_017833 [Phlomoides rotata]
MLSRHEECMLNLHVLVREEELEGEKKYPFPRNPSLEIRRFCQKRQPPSRVDTAPAPPGRARDLNAFARADGARDVEESTDNAPPVVVAGQLEAFKNEIEAMHKQIHDRVSDLRPVTGRQFTHEILQDELSFNFKPLNYEYDGTTDPYEHLMRFENSAILHQYEVKINVLTNGIRDGDLFSSLAKKPVAIFNDLLRRAEKYMTLEEDRKAKKAESKPSVNEKNKPPKVKPAYLEHIGRRFRIKFEKYKPLKLLSTEVL